MNVECVKKYFEPNSILDIGAHCGDFYRECVKTFPNAYYFLVEANTECKEALQQLNIPYFIGVLSDSVGYTNFYRTKLAGGCTPMSTGNSIYKEKTSYYNDENVLITIEPTFLLDSVVNCAFDLIKIDVQGAELNVLRGGVETVKTAKAIIMEVAVSEYNEFAPLETDILNFMKDLGFTPKEIIGIHMNPETHEYIQKDVLFLRNNLP